MTTSSSWHAEVTVTRPDGSTSVWKGPGESTDPISREEALASAEAAALAEEPPGTTVVKSRATDTSR